MFDGFLSRLKKSFAEALEENARNSYAAVSRRVVTSSGGVVHGRRIVRQVKMLHVANMRSAGAAEHSMLLAAEAAGANGIVNFRIRHHRGGFVSAQGDAVLLSS